MSLLLREPLDIWLAANEVEVLKRVRPGRAPSGKRLLRRADDPRPATRWIEETLAQALVGTKHASARVLLSNTLVRYAIVPWQRGVLSDVDRGMLGTATLRSIYGDRADGWSVAMTAPRVGHSSIAGAIDSDLVRAIGTRLAAADVRMDTIEPLYCRAFDSIANRFAAKKDLWFAVAEPGHVCLGMADKGTWQVLRARPVRRRIADELLILLEQMRLVGGVERGAGDVHVYVRGDVGPIAWPKGMRWTAKFHGLPAVKPTKEKKK